MTTADIIKLVISLAVTVITGCVIPLIKAKKGTEEAKKDAKKFDGYVAKAQTVVDAAYQMFESNDERKAFAVKTLMAFGVPKPAIDTVIEAAVKACKVAGTAIAAVKDVETATDAAAGITEADAAQAAAAQAAADKLAKLTQAAQDLGVDTAGMDAAALQAAITAAVAA
jgi:hypothetical protein